MSEVTARRNWALIERISPKAAKLLREADGLKSMASDFEDIFDFDADSTRENKYLALPRK